MLSFAFKDSIFLLKNLSKRGVDLLFSFRKEKVSKKETSLNNGQNAGDADKMGISGVAL